MWSWRSSSNGPRVGVELCLWGLGVVAGSASLALGGVVPTGGKAALAALAGASVAWICLRGGWPPAWFLLGLSLGGLASARTVALWPQEARIPVRFVGVVRDGWRGGETGWSTRVRLVQWEGLPTHLKPPGELTLTVGGSAQPWILPPPGATAEGAGELVWRPHRGVLPALWVKSPLLLKTRQPAQGLDGWRQACREQLAAAAGFSLTRQRAAALAAALVLGRREGLPEEEVAALRQAGLAHLLAVSGLHVGLVAAFFWYLLLFFGFRPQTRRWVLIPMVIGFALLSGGASPVRRAATATVLLLLARQRGRPLELLPVFWGVVGLLVLLEPWAVWEVGFQLSAGVALALVRWVPVLADRGRGLGAAVAVALVAQLASWPITGVHFGFLPVLGMACNLLAAPLAAVMVAVALLATGTAWVVAGLAGWFLDGLGLCSWLLQQLAHWGSQLLWAFPPLKTGVQVLLAVLFCGALLPFTGARWAALAVGVSTLAAVFWAYCPGSTPAQTAMLPVRQGMALLVAGREGRLLVDAGRPPREALVGVAAWRSASLDALVLTHPDQDHVGGASLVLSVLRPSQLWLPQVFLSRPELLPLLWEARRRGVKLVPLSAGQRVRLGEIACDVLWPPPRWEGEDNDGSLVLRCRLAATTLLVTGDLSAFGEGELLRSGVVVQAQVLQVAHHGSRTSTGEDFLRAVAPRLALVPTGSDPPFPFPHPSVMARLRAARVLAVVQNRGLGGIRWVEGRGWQLGTDPPVFLGGGGE
ncbi:MAG: DNA internalization-related competence protein ComEC/Rec2 [Thermoanaerobaculum sp.]|nr:DNA internalization-related competence protein ComEC/Rec2 [Thermoanaerobaculum sp.]